MIVVKLEAMKNGIKKYTENALEKLKHLHDTNSLYKRNDQNILTILKN